MNRASVQELECFVAVAEELNFSRAARKLNMSQPPLSRQIRGLEEKLGVRLLQRSTRAVSLTSAGALYLEDARQVLTKLDAAASSARRAHGGEDARLSLAFVGALLDEKLVAALQAFRRLHPRCQIHLADLAPAEQLAALAEGQVDGAFIGASPRRMPRGVESMVWKREPLLLAVPERHALAGFRTVSLAQLKNESWVMVSRAAAPAFRQQFDRLCRAAGIQPRVVQESERVGAVMTMVAVEQGISLMPEAVSRLVHPGVVFRALARPQAVLDHTFACRRATEPGMMADFLKMLCRAAQPARP
jgi:DNA-binding transcriptional LysR family regulator